jgi:hypothetical protein
MRRGFLALLALLNAGSIASAQAQFVSPPGLTIQTTAAAKVSPDDVVTRLMTFDHNNDGRVTIGELSERMHPVVARGDKNGDGALDRLELQALAVAPLSAVPSQTGRIFGQAGGYSFGDEAGLSSKMHIEGALDDLRLASDKKDRALPIVRAYVDTVEQAAKADLTTQMERLLSPEQLTVFTTLLNADERRQLTLKTNTGDRQVFVMNVRGDLARRVEAMHLVAPKDEQARKAIDRFKTRIRLGEESDRLELMAQLKTILNAEEIDNYRAALERRPVVATGPQFFAVNDVMRRAQETFGVVKPAVLIEQQTPVTIISR